MRKQIAALTILSLPATASASLLGVGFGAGYDYWTATPSGQMADGNVDIDLDDNLSMEDSSEGQMWAYFEHPLPLIPDARIQKGRMASEGSGGEFDFTLATEFGDFDGQMSDIDTSFEMDMTDFIVYWSPLPENILTLGILSLDVGVNYRTISGELYMEGTDPGGTTRTVDESFSAPVPMGYGSLRANIPGTGVSLGGAVSTLSMGGNEFTDTTMDVSWRSPFGLGVRGGVRTLDMVIDEDIEFDMSFSGAFLGAFYQF